MRTQAALAGVNAAVVGLLLAALYQPVWTSAIHQSQETGSMSFRVETGGGLAGLGGR